MSALNKIPLRVEAFILAFRRVLRKAIQQGATECYDWVHAEIRVCTLQSVEYAGFAPPNFGGGRDEFFNK